MRTHPRAAPTPANARRLSWLDLSGFSTLELVLPFLAVVRSREANGLLTDAALRSLQVFLGQRLVGGAHRILNLVC